MIELSAFPKKNLNPHEIEEHEESERDENEDKDNGIIFPKDILLLIFSYSTKPEELLNLALVCKSWKALSSHNFLWSPIILRKWPHIAKRCDNSTNLKQIYITQHKSLRVSSADKGFHMTVTPRIPGLTPIYRLRKGHIVAVTKQRTLKTLDCKSGEITKELAPQMPGKIERFGISDLALFDTHYTMVIHWHIGNDLHKSIVAINPLTGELLTHLPFSTTATTVKINEGTALLKEKSTIREVDYWKHTVLPTIQLPFHSPSFQVAKPLFQDQKVFLQKIDDSVEVFCLPEGKLEKKIPAKGALLQACDGVVYTCKDNYFLHLWCQKSGKLLKTLNMQEHVRKEYRLFIRDLKIYGDFLIMKVDYKYWINKFGMTVPHGHNTFECNESSILLFNKNTLHFLQAIHFNFSLSSNYSIENGKLILREFNKMSCLEKKFQIFDLTTPDPKESKKCCIVQ